MVGVFVMSMVRCYFAVIAALLFLVGVRASCLADEKPIITREQRDAIVASRDRIAAAIEVYGQRVQTGGERCSDTQDYYACMVEPLSLFDRLRCHYQAQCVLLAKEVESFVDSLAYSAVESQYKNEILSVVDDDYSGLIKLLGQALSGYKETCRLYGGVSVDASDLEMLISTISRELVSVENVISDLRHHVVSHYNKFTNVHRMRAACREGYVWANLIMNGYLSGVARDYNVSELALVSFLANHAPILNASLNRTVIFSSGVNVAPSGEFSWKEGGNLRRKSVEARNELLRHAQVVKSMVENKFHQINGDIKSYASCIECVMIHDDCTSNKSFKARD